MNKIIKIFFSLLILHPLISFLVWNVLGMFANKLYQLSFIIIAGFYLLLRTKKTLFPKYLWLLVAYSLYVFTWDYIHGFYQSKGFIVYFSSWNSLHLIVLILFLENMPYLGSFPFKILQVIPYIIVSAFVITIIQVIYSPYFWSNTGNVIAEYTGGNIYLARRPSIFGWGDQLNIGLGFFPLTAIFIATQVEKHKKYILWLFLIGTIAIASNSRYIIGAFLIISTYPIYYTYKQKRSQTLPKVIGYGLISIIGIFVAFNLIGYDLQDFINTRLFAEGSVEETSRYKAIDTFVHFFPQKPLFGDGYRVSEEVREASNKVGSSHIHVGYLQRLVSYGILGCFFLYSFLFTLAKKLWKIGKEHNYYGGFIAFIIFLFANATFTRFNFFYFGIVIALFSSFYIRKYDKQPDS